MPSYPPEHLVALDGSVAAWCGVEPPPLLETLLNSTEDLAPGTQIGVCVVNGDGTYTTVAGTGPLVYTLDELHFSLDEGPGLTAMREEHTVIVDDAESEHRWPAFTRRAVDLGLRSYLGMPITMGDRTVGGLNLYSTVHVCLDTARLAAARLLAAQAAVCLGQSQRENNLVAALQSSRTIGKAIGLVMERFDLDDHEAFEYLVRMSQKSNLKVRDIAAHLVKQSNDLRHLGEARQLPNPVGLPDLTLVPSPDTRALL